MSSSETTKDSQNNHSSIDGKVVTKEDNYRRDSFNDRFCDDLCPEILQYLSLEDKLRLQCVSKQFERTVFKRQYELYIKLVRADKSDLSNKDSIIIKVIYGSNYIEGQRLDLFKALLKKCPNITSIEVDGFECSYYDYDSNKFNQVLGLIIENYNNLSEVIVDKHINDSNFEGFHRKFGPKIKYLQFSENHFDLSLFPNIEKLIINIRNYNLINPQLKLAKVKKLDIELDYDQEHMLQIVINTFPTLTHLNLYFYSSDENAIYESLKNISNLKHLIHLKLNNQFERYSERFCVLLEQMANNCKNLKSIDCYFNIDQNSDIRELLSHLKAFPALKRLYLGFFFVNYEDMYDIDVNQMFSFELFKGFENITHFSLFLNRYLIFYKSKLKEIDINLPKLQYLQIFNRFETTTKGVKQMVDILSRLSRLETLKLNFKSGVDFKPIEEQITEKCRKIKEIGIQFILWFRQHFGHLSIFRTRGRLRRRRY